MLKLPDLSGRSKLAANFLAAAVAPIICALFLLAGLPLVDDYGIQVAQYERDVGEKTVDYILGKNDALMGIWDRFKGPALQVPLLLLERGLGLADPRAIALTHHFVTYLLFILGGFCCYLLVYRLFNHRLLALCALLLFLLHPRLYAHAFFNSRDLPFLSMFMIALYLLEWAFRRDTVGAFVLSGVVVGLTANIRIMGMMLFPAVLAMRGFDFFAAAGGAKGKQILLAGGGFALASVITLYATWPWLWGDPAERFLSVFARMAHYPNVIDLLFRGEVISAAALPPDYIPTWFVITTPPLFLLLGLVGSAAVVGAGVMRPGRIFCNNRLRCGLLLLAVFTLPVAMVILLDSVLYGNWRQMYFLYAPFCLLAVFGVRWLATVRRQRAWQGGVYGLTGAGLLLIVLQMVQLHPQQQFYFNFLVDRTTPEYLRTQYAMDYWRVSLVGDLKYLLERHPEGTVYLSSLPWAADFLPPAARQRLALSSETRDPDYVVLRRFDLEHQPDLAFNRICDRQIYNNTISIIKGVDTAGMGAAAVDAYKEIYRQSRSETPIIRGDYDVYRSGRNLVFSREDCPPGDLSGRFVVKVFPIDPEKAPGFNPEGETFIRFSNSGVRLVDNTCLAVIQLPDYAQGDILVGHHKSRNATGFPFWEEWHSFARPGLSDIIADRRRQQSQPSPLNAFDVFLDQRAGGGKRLLYAKGNCSRPEYETRIFLHIYPVNSDSLPPERREIGFANRDFYLSDYGGRPGGDCLAAIPLPDYPIAEIRTGQYTPGQGQLWAAELMVER